LSRLLVIPHEIIVYLTVIDLIPRSLSLSFRYHPTDTATVHIQQPRSDRDGRDGGERHCQSGHSNLRAQQGGKCTEKNRYLLILEIIIWLI